MTSPHAALAERFDQMIAVRAEHERLTARLAALAPQVREADEELDRLGEALGREKADVRRLEDASFSYSSLTGWEERDQLDDFLALSRRVWRTRAYGDFWSYMLLAEGAVDIAAEPELELYDMAALDIIVHEAGGRFTSLDGADGPWGGNAVATNGHLHDAAMAFLGGVDDEDDPDEPRRGPGFVCAADAGAALAGAMAVSASSSAGATPDAALLWAEPADLLDGLDELDGLAASAPLELTLSLTAAEHARLRDRADAQGVSLEEALRRLI